MLFHRLKQARNLKTAKQNTKTIKAMISLNLENV